MKWTSALSHNANLHAAIDEITAQTLAALGAPPDLAFLFATDHYRAGFDRLPATVHARLGGGQLLGCSASGVIGSGEEIEQRAALSLVAAQLSDVDADSWALEATDLAPGTLHSQRCAALAHKIAPKPVAFVLLADPFTFQPERLIRSLESAFPSRAIVGGLASGGQAPGEIALFLNDTTRNSGALILALSGDIEMQTAVAQGCRPIGDPLFVSSCQGNRITGLDGQSPIDVLSTLFERAGKQDQMLMQHSLFVGIAMRAGESQYDQGDYLIRNITGIDQSRGAIAVGVELHENQVVQFHLRDARTAAEDLDRVLSRLHDQYLDTQPAGALLFSCTGRGQGLYGEAGHDSGVFHRRFGAIPLGGFFCNGEIGPVGGTTFLHGYTSAFAVFNPLESHPNSR
ncbi:MAG: hypothetical protein A3H91_02245 [Gammaproteobacteria bacterium RIFCSPLOWO2_02_FULL_61_13]|nr:MAG: hypothetical protein A3H91_02245 [Gammaproteobacteria bacterium RIFCSPLOWO2_02_FULL_61_13]